MYVDDDSDEDTDESSAELDSCIHDSESDDDDNSTLFTWIYRTKC